MITLGFVIAIGLPLAVLILAVTLPDPTGGTSVDNEIFRVEPHLFDLARSPTTDGRWPAGDRGDRLGLIGTPRLERPPSSRRSD